MNITVESEERNEGLERLQVEGTVSFDGTTPSRDDIRSELETEYPDGHVVVRVIDARFGSDTAKVYAVIYDDAEVMERVEQEYMQERHVSETVEESEESAEAEEGSE